MNILQPGRELDQLVAEKVMGWDVVCGNDILDRDHPGMSEEEKSKDRWHKRKAWFLGTERKACDECGTMPEFSTSIEAAWQVVEKLGIVRISNGWTRGEWKVEFSIPGCEVGFQLVYAKASTVPHAICQAALKAVERRTNP